MEINLTLRNCEKVSSGILDLPIHQKLDMRLCRIICYNTFLIPMGYIMLLYKFIGSVSKVIALVTY